MKLLVICPKCNGTMKFYPVGSPYKQKKKCVYCGRSFTVKSLKVDRIVKEL